MTISRSRNRVILRRVLSLALVAIAAGCDTDMYHDTSGCRDETNATPCPIDEPAPEDIPTEQNAMSENRQ
jgi:hypothetical protein